METKWNSLSEGLRRAIIRELSPEEPKTFTVPDSWWEGTGQRGIIPSSFLPAYVEEKMPEPPKYDPPAEVKVSDAADPPVRKRVTRLQPQLPGTMEVSDADKAEWRRMLDEEIDLCEEDDFNFHAIRIWNKLGTMPHLIHTLRVRLDPENRKLMNGRMKSIPGPSTGNPIAAITNYFRHNLKTEINIRVEELPSHNPSEPNYEHTIYGIEIPGFPVIELAKFTHSRKKYGKECAAKCVLEVLNRCTILVKLYVIASLARP